MADYVTDPRFEVGDPWPWNGRPYYGQELRWHYGRRGPYYGVGPKGYVRQDGAILDEVCHRLWADEQIDAGNVEVDIRHGEITLRGTVPDRQQKRLAEAVCDAVAGVRDVHNQLTLAMQPPATTRVPQPAPPPAEAA